MIGRNTLIIHGCHYVETLERERQRALLLLLAGDTNPKVVSEGLGHAFVGITLDTYSHLMPDMQEKAAEALEDRLRYRILRCESRLSLHIPFAESLLRCCIGPLLMNSALAVA